MKVDKELMSIYRRLSWYNRRKLVEANRPCGKQKRNRDGKSV